MIRQGQPRPRSVNFHFTSACNMRCRFCFAVFRDVGRPLAADEAERLSTLLAEHFCKVTFVGGEPTLHPRLPDLLRGAKEAGAAVHMVTNGSLLTRDYLARFRGILDCVALSIDSASPATHRLLGRSIRGRTVPPARYLDIAKWVRECGMWLKVNTVVTLLNADEDMAEMLLALAPRRWKLLRVLPVAGQNDGRVEGLAISAESFRLFAARHLRVEEAGVRLVVEDHSDLIGSYAMVSPDGRFFDNVRGCHSYSDPILEVGVDAAWSQVAFDAGRHVRRGGSYNPVTGFEV